MTPTQKAPDPVELDINQDDGFTLTADGELSPSETFVLPGPTPQIESSRTSRFGLKSRPPPARRVSLAKKSPTLGCISPSCSGFRFPDLPSPLSPSAVKQDFKELIAAVKKRQEKREKSTLYEGVRHPSGLASPARKPVQLHIDVVASDSPIIQLQLPISRPSFNDKKAKAAVPEFNPFEAASPTCAMPRPISPVATTPTTKNPVISPSTAPVRFPDTPSNAVGVKLFPLITTPTKGKPFSVPCTPPRSTRRLPMVTSTRVPSIPKTPVYHQTRSPRSPPSSSSVKRAAARAAALARWEQFKAAHAMGPLVRA
ncbi:hypothetical protein OF83DRAFT_1084505 [Amylostereum chailletii]|nr:hypothetical protein OF83DRAFT_1084505 [Amylostereum chailletii]